MRMVLLSIGRVRNMTDYYSHTRIMFCTRAGKIKVGGRREKKSVKERYSSRTSRADSIDY